MEFLYLFLTSLSLVGPPVLPPIIVETSGSGSADFGSGSASGGHSGDFSSSGDQSGSRDTSDSGDQVTSGKRPGSGDASGSGDQVTSGDLSGSGSQVSSGDWSGAGDTSGSGDQVTSGDTSGSGDQITSGDLSGSGSQVSSGDWSGAGDTSGSGDQVTSGDLSWSGGQVTSGDLSGSGEQVISGDLSGSGEMAGSASAELPNGASGLSRTGASGSAFDEEGSGIHVVFSGTDIVLSGDGSVSGGLQEAGEGSTGVLNIPFFGSGSGSGVLSGSGDISGSGFSSMESGSSLDTSGTSGQFSGIWSGFINNKDVSGFSGFPSGFSSGSASGHSGTFLGSGNPQILLINDELIDESILVSQREHKLGGGLPAFSGSGDIPGSGILSGDLSGSASGSGSGFFSGVTFVGSGFAEVIGSSSGEQETSRSLLSSGEHVSGSGISTFISGSGSGSGKASGLEASASGEGSVGFLTEDLITQSSGDTLLSLELGQGSVEYSGEGSSSTSALYSASEDNRMFSGSGTPSGLSSGQVLPPSMSSEWTPPERDAGPAEALGEVLLAQVSGVVNVTHSSVVAPAGLAAPPTAAAPAPVGPPGVAMETDLPQGKFIIQSTKVQFQVYSI